MRSEAAPAPAPAARPLHRQPAFALFCAYALFVAYATLLPFQFVTDAETLQAKSRWINWNPLHLVSGEPTPLTDLVANVLFFLPLGFIGFHAQRPRRALVAVLRAAGAGMLLSLSVEALQYLTPVRNPATSDVLTNTLGACVGALFGAAFQRQMQGPVRRRLLEWLRREPLLPVLACYAVLVVLAAFVPFDLAVGIGWLKRAVREARLRPSTEPLQWLAEAQVALQFAVLAGLASHVLRRLRVGGWLRRLLVAAAASTLLAAVLEIAQLFVRSRVTATLDVLAAGAGALLGTLLAVGLGGGRRARYGWTLVAAGYVAALAVATLQPFVFDFAPESMRARLSPTALVPYSSYYYKANVAAVADFLEGLLLYLPLAFVLARMRSGPAWERRPHTGVWVVVACAGLALGLEILQLGVPRRYPEISDVLTAALGAALGAYAWRWIGSLQSMAHEGARVSGGGGSPPGAAAPPAPPCGSALGDAATEPIAPASS